MASPHHHHKSKRAIGIQDPKKNVFFNTKKEDGTTHTRHLEFQ
jgi:hypothetical protein